MIKKIILILFLLPFALFSQINDFQIWTSVNLGYSLNKKNEFNLEQSLRTFQNANTWSNVFTELSYTHKLNKHFFVGAIYRFSFKNRLDYYLTAHRLSFVFKAKKKINDFGLNYRFIIQSEMLGIKQKQDWILPKWYNRHQFKLKYKISKKLKPYLSYEMYIALGEQFSPFNKYRITGGTTYNFNKKNSINIYYRYQNIHFFIPFNSYILGISYKYNL